MVAPHVERVCVRGDTDFSLTANFDRWSEEPDFIFGFDNHSGTAEKPDPEDPVHPLTDLRNGLRATSKSIFCQPAEPKTAARGLLTYFRTSGGQIMNTEVLPSLAPTRGGGHALAQGLENKGRQLLYRP